MLNVASWTRPSTNGCALSVLATWLLATACAATPDAPPVHAADELQSVAIDISGGTCAACWRTLGVEADGVLILEDDRGEERFDLSDAEFDPLLDLVAGEDFQGELGDPTTWSCSLLLDVETTVEARWTDGTVQSVKLLDGCFGRCDEPEHPLMALRARLFELKERYMAPLCPPNADRYPEYCAIAPEPPPPPESRMLCGVCLDDCAIPIPQGTPPRGPVDST